MLQRKACVPGTGQGGTGVFCTCAVFLSSSFSDTLYTVRLSISLVQHSKFPLTFAFRLNFSSSVLMESFVIIIVEEHVLWLLLIIVIRESKLK